MDLSSRFQWIVLSKQSYPVYSPHKRKNPAYWLNQKAGFLGALKIDFLSICGRNQVKAQCSGLDLERGSQGAERMMTFYKNWRSKTDFAPSWLTTMKLLFLKLVAAQRVSWVSPVLVPNSPPLHTLGLVWKIGKDEPNQQNRNSGNVNESLQIKSQE